MQRIYDTNNNATCVGIIIEIPRIYFSPKYLQKTKKMLTKHVLRIKKTMPEIIAAVK